MLHQLFRYLFLRKKKVKKIESINLFVTIKICRKIRNLMM